MVTRILKIGNVDVPVEDVEMNQVELLFYPDNPRVHNAVHSSNIEDPSQEELEKEMLEKINCLGIGPAGLGGTVTALAVHIETYPTHIAGLPVAVNICCHANRHVVREL